MSTATHLPPEIQEQTRPLTYADLLALPDDGRRYEIIEGELIVAAAPIRRHQRFQMRVADVLYDQEKAGYGEAYVAPVDVRLSPHAIVQPDVLFLTSARTGIYLESGLVEGPPDIVVEILSPSTRRIDLVRKAALYARAGVPEYWTGDPDAPDLMVQVLDNGVYHRLPPEGRIQRSRVLPSLALDLTALLAGL